MQGHRNPHLPTNPFTGWSFGNEKPSPQPTSPITVMDPFATKSTSTQLTTGLHTPQPPPAQLLTTAQFQAGVAVLAAMRAGVDLLVELAFLLDEQNNIAEAQSCLQEARALTGHTLDTLVEEQIVLFLHDIGSSSREGKTRVHGTPVYDPSGHEIYHPANSHEHYNPRLEPTAAQQFIMKLDAEKSAAAEAEERVKRTAAARAKVEVARTVVGNAMLVWLKLEPPTNGLVHAALVLRQQQQQRAQMQRQQAQQPSSTPTSTPGEAARGYASPLTDAAEPRTRMRAVRFESDGLVPSPPQPLPACSGVIDTTVAGQSVLLEPPEGQRLYTIGARGADYNEQEASLPGGGGGVGGGGSAGGGGVRTGGAQLANSARRLQRSGSMSRMLDAAGAMSGSMRGIFNALPNFRAPLERTLSRRRAEAHAWGGARMEAEDQRRDERGQAAATNLFALSAAHGGDEEPLAPLRDHWSRNQSATAEPQPLASAVKRYSPIAFEC